MVDPVDDTYTTVDRKLRLNYFVLYVDVKRFQVFLIFVTFYVFRRFLLLKHFNITTLV